ncbi:transporter substrate-binding domain-containing protein, partial [Candidatus Poribacteria bacterium]
YMPFFFEGADGRPRGILVDIWDLWSRKTGVPVSFLTLPWAETLTQVRDGKVDINAGVFYTTERDTYLDFSQPFFDLATHLFYHTTDKPLTGIDNLVGIRVGLVTEDFSVGYVQKNQDATRPPICSLKEKGHIFRIGNSEWLPLRFFCADANTYDQQYKRNCEHFPYHDCFPRVTFIDPVIPDVYSLPILRQYINMKVYSI